jgi:transcriptional regulator with AAA-type ATPase domain
MDWRRLEASQADAVTSVWTEVSRQGDDKAFCEEVAAALQAGPPTVTLFLVEASVLQPSLELLADQVADSGRTARRIAAKPSVPYNVRAALRKAGPWLLVLDPRAGRRLPGPDGLLARLSKIHHETPASAACVYLVPVSDALPARLFKAHDPWQGLIGESGAMKRLRAEILEMAQGEFRPRRILLEGESGVGKTIVARKIHQLSGRRGEFVYVSCGTLGGDLLENELFGHVKGAFTGATEDKEGAVARADGGTLFLDDIHQLRPDLHGKLLRLADEGRFSPVGAVGDKERSSDLLLIAASSRDLKRLVDDGVFLGDLYYRLLDGHVRIPPLRERLEDVRLLVEHAAEQSGADPSRVRPEVATDLATRVWEGNVRQLESVVRSLLRKAGRGRPVTLELLAQAESVLPPRRQQPVTTQKARPAAADIRQVLEGFRQFEARRLEYESLLRRDWSVTAGIVEAAFGANFWKLALARLRTLDAERPLRQLLTAGEFEGILRQAYLETLERVREARQAPDEPPPPFEARLAAIEPFQEPTVCRRIYAAFHPDNVALRQTIERISGGDKAESERLQAEATDLFIRLREAADTGDTLAFVGLVLDADQRFGGEVLPKFEPEIAPALAEIISQGPDFWERQLDEMRRYYDDKVVLSWNRPGEGTATEDVTVERLRSLQTDAQARLRDARRAVISWVEGCARLDAEARKECREVIARFSSMLDDLTRAGAGA